MANQPKGNGSSLTQAVIPKLKTSAPHVDLTWQISVAFECGDITALFDASNNPLYITQLTVSPDTAAKIEIAQRQVSRSRTIGLQETGGELESTKEIR